MNVQRAYYPKTGPEIVPLLQKLCDMLRPYRLVDIHSSICMQFQFEKYLVYQHSQSNHL